MLLLKNCSQYFQSGFEFKKITHDINTFDLTGSVDEKYFQLGINYYIFCIYRYIYSYKQSIITIIIIFNI